MPDHTSENKGGNHKARMDYFPQPPQSSDPAPSDFYLFGALKDSNCGKRFGSDDGVTEDKKTWLSTKFKLVQEGDRCSCFLLSQSC